MGCLFLRVVALTSFRPSLAFSTCSRSQVLYSHPNAPYPKSYIVKVSPRLASRALNAHINEPKCQTSPIYRMTPWKLCPVPVYKKCCFDKQHDRKPHCRSFTTHVQTFHTTPAPASRIEDLLQDHDQECHKEGANGFVDRPGCGLFGVVGGDHVVWGCIPSCVCRSRSGYCSGIC